MSIKIFGGFAKGYTLQTPSQLDFRPTQVTLRRKFFDKYQDLSDYHFYDLCAGSGAVGLEALSHHAKAVTFIEFSNKTFQQLKHTIKSFNDKFSDYQLTINYEKEDCLKWLERHSELFLDENAIIFFDPPYEKKEMYLRLIDLIKSVENLKAVVLIEGDSQKTFKIDFFESQLDIKKVFEQGTNYILMI